MPASFSQEIAAFLGSFRNAIHLEGANADSHLYGDAASDGGGFLQLRRNRDSDISVRRCISGGPQAPANEEQLDRFGDLYASFRGRLGTCKRTQFGYAGSRNHAYRRSYLFGAGPGSQITAIDLLRRIFSGRHGRDGYFIRTEADRRPRGQHCVATNRSLDGNRILFVV